MDVLNLLRRSEGKTLEFKRALSSPKGVLRTLVAFANTSGGVLLIGVEDKSGNVVGVPNPLDLEERLASLISDSISPRLVPELHELSKLPNQTAQRNRTRILPLLFGVHPSL